MGNDLISVKDLILSEEDVKALQKAKAPDKKEYSYRVLMESGCDFAVERREKGNNNIARLVVLVSQNQSYVEQNGIRKKLTCSALKSFLSGLNNNEKILLQKVNWLDYLKNDKEFCRLVYNCLGGDMFRDNRGNEMLRHGYFFLMEEDSPFSMYGDPKFGERKYAGGDRIIVNDFAPPEDEVILHGRFQSIFGEPCLGNTFDEPRFFYDPEGMAWDNPLMLQYCIRLYGGYNPVILDHTAAVYGSGVYCNDFQYAFYMLSPTLYRHMLRLMKERFGLSNKENLKRVFKNWNSRESLLFQSFLAFALMEHAYGADIAKLAMEKYLTSQVEDVIPFTQLSIFLYGTRSIYNRMLGDICLMDGRQLKGKKPVFELNSSSFLKYLFEESVRQGYGNNLNLFFYQWGQTLYLQKLMELKNIDKYPQYLASKAVEVLSLVEKNASEIEKNIWRDAYDYSKHLEYKGEKYQIVVPKSSADLIKEANQQQNCLRSYENRILQKTTRVCFLRETDPLKADKSLVTIEVDDNGRVLQCKAKCNRNPSEEKWAFILEWEKAKNLVDFTHQIPDEMLEDPFE